MIALIRQGDAQNVGHFADVLEDGRRRIDAGEAENPANWRCRVERDDDATLIYTSGTTDFPRGDADPVQHCFQRGRRPAARRAEGEPGRHRALLPAALPHLRRTADYYFYWDNGTCIAYAESIEKVADNMGEVRSPPDGRRCPGCDKIYAKVMGATGIKKKLVMWAKGIGESIADERFAGREPPGCSPCRATPTSWSFKLHARTGAHPHLHLRRGTLAAEVGKFFSRPGCRCTRGMD